PGVGPRPPPAARRPAHTAARVRVGGVDQRLVGDADVGCDIIQRYPRNGDHHDVAVSDRVPDGAPCGSGRVGQGGKLVAVPLEADEHVVAAAGPLRGKVAADPPRADDPYLHDRLEPRVRLPYSERGTMWPETTFLRPTMGS